MANERYKKNYEKSKWDWGDYSLLGLFGLCFSFGSWVAATQADENYGPSGKYSDKPETIVNWSGTHKVLTRRVQLPETGEQLQDLVESYARLGRGLRPLGTALSPNGLAFRSEGMISLQLMDAVLGVDIPSKQVHVQAGCRVQELADKLKPYGLTLQNFASIREQTLGGFYQVGAHGTGPRIPPVDEQVVGMTLVTPNGGVLELSPTMSPELFYMARVGLGALGVVRDVRIRCVDAHLLQEKTFVTTRGGVRKNHAKWLRDNRHIRYMWIPYTDTVVVVTCNPTRATQPSAPPPHAKAAAQEAARLKPMVDLLLSQRPEAQVEGRNFAGLRDELLRLDPLNKEWVVEVNKAEAAFWKNAQDSRVGWSDDILGFDCGGQQWVHEVCIPSGTPDQPSLVDLDYMEELLHLIESRGIAAPAPIEQRWSSGSRSPMSPAHAEEKPQEALFSWVGIIMYLPTTEMDVRDEISSTFLNDYSRMVQMELLRKYNGAVHWAKLQVPGLQDDLEYVQDYLRAKFPIDRFNSYRDRLDNRRVLSNGTLNILMP